MGEQSRLKALRRDAREKLPAIIDEVEGAVGEMPVVGPILPPADRFVCVDLAAPGERDRTVARLVDRVGGAAAVPVFLVPDRPAPAAPRPEVLHRRQLFGGRETAEEVHAKTLAMPCVVCRRPGMIKFTTLVEKAELMRRKPKLCLAVMMRNGMRLPTVETKYGTMVNISSVAACRRCAPAVEREASRHPSWAVVDIDRGPGPDVAIVAVGP